MLRKKTELIILTVFMMMLGLILYVKPINVSAASKTEFTAGSYKKVNKEFTKILEIGYFTDDYGFEEEYGFSVNETHWQYYKLTVIHRKTKQKTSFSGVIKIDGKTKTEFIQGSYGDVPPANISAKKLSAKKVKLSASFSGNAQLAVSMEEQFKISGTYKLYKKINLDEVG